MLSLIIFIFLRIFSNSYLNVFQKLLTSKGEKSSVINFYSYLGLMLIGFMISFKPIFHLELIVPILVMGFLGSLGNYFIIKALSCGELSTLAPINSYKPIVALIFGIFLLNEIPSFTDLIGILLIITGTFFLSSYKTLFNKATSYRFLALIFSGLEAIFIKKIILLSDIQSAFLYWAIAGFIFATLFVILSKHKLKIERCNVKFQVFLILMIFLMQYSTNYVFEKINVAYALALFQLSTLVSVFLGANIFKERNLAKKIIAASIMLIGAIILILL
jgi:drug/metabolite transporter (DMT)-like permease